MPALRRLFALLARATGSLMASKLGKVQGTEESGEWFAHSMGNSINRHITDAQFTMCENHQ